MGRYFCAVWLMCLALAALCAHAQNETHTAPTLVEVLTPSSLPIVNEILGTAFNPEVLKLQTAIGVRYTLLFMVSDYELIAACDPKALSFFGTKDEIPADFCTPLNQRIIASYIIHTTISSEFPKFGAIFAQFLTKAGLNPFNTSRDKNTLNGWANSIADRLINYFSNDGWNALGDATRDDFRQPFSDQTGYKPVNPAYLTPDKLYRPLRWQPITGEKDGNGDFFSQVHVVPQIGSTVKPLVLTPDEFQSRKLPSPYQSPNMKKSISPEDEKKLRGSISKLLKRSERMTEKKVALVYFWDTKFLSVGGFNGYYRLKLGFDRKTWLRFVMGDHLAFHDSLLLTWKEKVRHDLVRPTTMIRRLLKDESVKAFRGVGKGVGLVKAKKWEPVIPPQPHAEYPSATAALCQAGFEQLKVALPSVIGNRTIPPYDVVLNSGPIALQSASEVTAEVPIRFDTLDIAKRDCGYSRLDGGLHFHHSIPAGFKLTEGVGKIAYEHMEDLWSGRVPKNCARCIRT